MGNPDQEQPELLIDANVILEFLLARQRQKESLALLKLISTGDVTAWVMSYAVHSIEYMLYREGDLTALRNFLELLRSSLGLMVYDSNPAEDLAALDFTKKADAAFGLDFDDALHYATAKKHTFTLVSFDQDFDRTDLPRKTPADILSQNEDNASENDAGVAA
jgi:predicted nucleic acid-binding protein